MSEFDLRLVSWKGGIVAAIIASVKYLLVPFILLSVLVSIFRSGHQDWADLFIDLQMVVILFSPVLIGLAFFKGMYPRGSYSRAAFAVLALPVLLIFAYSLLLNGRVGAALADEGVDLDMLLLFYFAFAAAFLGLLVELGDFVDNRRTFLFKKVERVGGPSPMERVPEDPAKHRIWHDFRLRYGRWRPGFLESKRTLLRFVVWPTIVFLVMASVVSKINESVPVDIQNTLESTAALLMLIGVPLVVLAFFKGFYPKGSLSRFVPWVLMVAFICLWIWTATLGGVASVEVMDMATLRMDFSKIIYLFILAAALWAVYALVEMISYRPDWRRNNFYPVEESKVKERRDLEKAKRRMEKERRREAKRQGKG